MDKPWNLVSLGIHALLVRNVVLPLQSESRLISSIRTGSRAYEQPGPSAHASAYSWMACGGSDSCSGESTRRRPNRRASHSFLRGR